MPPESLTDPAATSACFARVEARLIERGEWRDEYAPVLAAFAATCAAYLTLTRQVRANGANSRDTRRFEATLRSAGRRGFARGLGARWLALFVAEPIERVPFTPLDADPLDAAIEALCSPLDGPDRRGAQ